MPPQVMQVVSFWGKPCFQRILAYTMTLFSEISSTLLEFEVPRLSQPVLGGNYKLVDITKLDKKLNHVSIKCLAALVLSLT